MAFLIQTGNPALERTADRQVEGLALAIQTVFPLTTEAAILVWNRVPVQLSYKYDFGDVTHDLLPMLDDVLSRSAGTTSVHWSSTTFSARWDMRWAGTRLEVVAKWESIAGGYEDVLNQRNRVELDRLQFLCEWKGPLHAILRALTESGITVADPAGDLDQLRRIEAGIPRFGQLYAVGQQISSPID